MGRQNKVANSVGEGGRRGQAPERTKVRGVQEEEGERPEATPLAAATDATGANRGPGEAEGGSTWGPRLAKQGGGAKTVT